jgi:hypothetical protein
MQKNREVGSNGFEAGFNHLMRRHANDDIVAIRDTEAEQLITDRAADGIGFHKLIMSRIGSTAIGAGGENRRQTKLAYWRALSDSLA